MRALMIGCTALLAMASPAMARGGIVYSQGNIAGYAMSDVDGASVPTVTRGAQFAVLCNGITSAGDDVKVVMSITNAPGDGDTGYAAVLATQQTVARHAVHVQVPDVPNLANHTVDVRVYVTKAHGIKACNAGRVRIV
jgi:hypothetical protein